MKTAPYIDPNGMARERERAPYGLALVTEGDRLFLAFLPEREGLTCLEYARTFAMVLRPDVDPQEAREVGERLLRLFEGLDAIYADSDPRPTYPSLCSCGRLRACLKSPGRP